ncbi:hypothetical protein H5410_050458 [Solanum commersonii]|uniref:Pectinesterase inhibitor domain-containing protein n=1 Tax=Solanum commersonii TaxID=4109 RepID=A0A9J5WWU6_SOLCO|nr:hypothetical protein H5410_050458 [Solanum commersonii]
MKGAMGSINTNRLMNPRTMTFVETQCRRTRYQELCVRTLSNYVYATSQDPQEIAQVALKMKAMIKAKVLNVAQVTTNALGLFNGFAARHKASHHVGYGKNKP